MAGKKVLSATQKKNKATLKEKLKALTVTQLRAKLKGKVKLSTREGKPLTKAQLVNKAAELQVTTPTQKRKRKAAVPTRNYTYRGEAGVSKRKDAARPALPPGKRVSKAGKTYFEYRRNRADIKQGAKKGQMLGGYNGWTNWETWQVGLWWGEYIYEIINDIKGQSDYDIAQHIKDVISDLYLDGVKELDIHVYDVVNSFLSEVNWQELVKTYKE